MLRYVFAVTLLTTQAILAAPVAELYVAPQGDDAAAASETAPLRSLAEAFSRSIPLPGTFPGESPPDIVVTLAPGVYEGFQLWNKGDKPRLTFRSADPANPAVVSAAVPITGWQPESGGRWKTKYEIKIGNVLYVNGKRATLARGPFPENAELYGDIESIDADKGYLAPGDAGMASWHYPHDIRIHYFNSWAHMICPVAYIDVKDGATRIGMRPLDFMLAKRKEGVQAQEPAFIENALELLDEPGEFYQDMGEGVVYYMPRPGEDMATAKVVACGSETLLSVMAARNVQFEAIVFADTTDYVDSHVDTQANCCIHEGNLFMRDGHLVNVNNEYRRKLASAVTVEDSRNITFRNCTFTRLGGGGIMLLVGCQDCAIVDCHFHDIAADAVVLGDVSDEDHHPRNFPVTENNRITGNHIHDIGLRYQGSVAIFCGYVKDTLIARNHIHDTPYSGISVGWGWGEQDAGGGAYEAPYHYSTPTPAANNIIEQNHIHHVMQQRDDGGAIYTLGNMPGSVIRQNHIHDNKNIPGGIYLDEGSGFIEITQNAVYNVPTPMNYNNRSQDRINTCNEHDNYFNLKPGDAAFPKNLLP